MKSLFADDARAERIERILQPRWVRCLLALAVWTFVALFFASQTYLSYKYSNGQAHTGIILELNLGNWYLWGLLAPGIIWLARKIPIEKSHWARNAFLHFVVGMGIALLKWWLDNLFRQSVLGLPGRMSLIFVFQQNL